MIDQITPLILTYNEAPNIEQTLERLRWAKEIMVVDSGSTDETLHLVQQFPQVRVLHRPFDSFAGQCNFGLERVQTEWVLSLDADYVLTQALVDEIKALAPADEISGYRCAFRYCIHGRPLRGTLYPPRTVLYRKHRARYEDDGHGHRVKINGTVVDLIGLIDHDDRKPLSRWITNQQSYSVLEADKLLSTPAHQLGFNDRVRKTGWLAPLLVVPYCLIWKRGILDGWAGWYYAVQRVIAEFMLCMELAERRLAR